MPPSASPSTSSSLLEQIKRGNEEAWHRLTQIYGPIVYRWARRRGLQPADAADVVQEVFQAVAVHVDGFRRDREGDSFRGWLWTIYRSKLMDHFRQRPIEFNARGNMQLSPEQPAPPSEDSDETARLVRRALGIIKSDFGERTWQAFWRSAVLEERTSHIASDLKMTAAAVCMSRSRVLRRLRETLAGLGVCPDDD